MAIVDDVYGEDSNAPITNVNAFKGAAMVLRTMIGRPSGAYSSTFGRLPQMGVVETAFVIGLAAPLVRSALERAVERYDATHGVELGPDFAGAYMLGCWPQPLTSESPWIRLTAPQTVADLSGTLDRIVTAFAAPALAQAAQQVTVRVPITPRWRGGDGADSTMGVNGRELMRGWTDLMLTAVPFLDEESSAWADEIQIEALWSAVRQLALAADAIGGAYVMRSAFARIVGALDEAKDKSAVAAGNVIAGAAEFAGETAGLVGKGVLEGLGLYGAAAIAAYFLLR